MNGTNGTILEIHSINVIIKLGVTLNQTIEDAIVMAKKYDCLVNFIFNDLQVVVGKESTVESTLKHINGEE